MMKFAKNILLYPALAALAFNLTACGLHSDEKEQEAARQRLREQMPEALEQVRGAYAGVAGAATAAAETYTPPVPQDGREMTLTELMDAAQDPQTMADMRAFFADALFIGDSRTVGLRQYAGLDQTDFFALTGMSVFDVFKNEAETAGQKTTLEGLLTQKQYSRIYLMLGINELGYNLSSIEKKYDEVVERLQTLQPQAQLWLQANLHVTQARSEKDAIYNNAAINALNDVIYAIAQERQTGWLDINPVFDDADGNLDPEYTYDHTHVLGKYYQYWTLWIYYQTK
ncbi:MAG: GDSL-type esterase/lipase family protein [Clostridia bacterium]|nr:GDSL-type esterase/lipase family protein [Clostridia bacterium]